MMNQQDIFKKIGNILTELNEQYDFLAHNPEKLSELELELFLANANFLSDHVEIIKKLNAQFNERAINPTGGAVEIIPVIEEVEPALLSKEEEAVKEHTIDEFIDVKLETEIKADNLKQETSTSSILNHDFFKPDTDKSDNTFEFDLSVSDIEGHKFDYEQKSVEEIFDRPLSKAEEEVLAQKKRIHAKDEEALNNPSSELLTIADDEIGPEPFLIHHEEEIAVLAEDQLESIPVLDAEHVENIVLEKEIEAVEEIAVDKLPESKLVEKTLFTPIVSIKPVGAGEIEKPTLNDLLAKGMQDPNTVSRTQAPIADLKQAINLNEKLLFIKDLFNGYNLAYSEAIDLVNKMDSFEHADAFLQHNYAVKNNWANKQLTVDQFYELLNRRFSK